MAKTRRHDPREYDDERERQMKRRRTKAPKQPVVKSQFGIVQPDGSIRTVRYVYPG